VNECLFTVYAIDRGDLMTDAEIAVQRLTAWIISDGGYCKAKNLVFDVSLLVLIAKKAIEDANSKRGDGSSEDTLLPDQYQWVKVADRLPEPFVSVIAWGRLAGDPTFESHEMYWNDRWVSPLVMDFGATPEVVAWTEMPVFVETQV